MANDIPTGQEALKTWLVDSSGNIAVSGMGLALLGSETDPLHAGSDEEFNSPDKARVEG